MTQCHDLILIRSLSSTLDDLGLPKLSSHMSQKMLFEDTNVQNEWPSEQLKERTHVCVHIIRRAIDEFVRV